MALNFQNNAPAPSGRLPLIITLMLSLVCVGIYGSEGADGPLHRVQSAVQGLVAPLQLAGAPLGSAVEGAEQAAENQNADEETLETLRAQNAELTQALTQAEEYRLEAQRLQALLNLKDTYDIDGVAARVIGRSTDAWNQTITLDVGSSDGVETGLTVMGPYGVIGQVISVSGGNCRVRLLTDPQSGAAALVQQSRAEGIVRGSLDGLLYLENIGADVNIQVGDVVLTSGLGGSYTRGLLIGTVARVEGSAGNDSRRIVVAPNDSVTLLQEALVVFSAASDAAERTLPASSEGEGTEGDGGQDAAGDADSQDDGASQEGDADGSDSDGSQAADAEGSDDNGEGGEA
ncbi:rod shape-determining protein MreC [uncultured Adlercreutzia sp.]|uniref:rod shape-determining protein MreC n=1 Tax=uncultured Adlercreutzia sp. TaxID=875803 RepID=UPI0025E1EB22|nr:rod shape-determining protein MreC [uncultured Adlercreutzia sp.]